MKNLQEMNTNLPVLSVERIIETLNESYCAVIDAGMSPKVLPSVMLWGPPGVGKSQAVRQIARDIKERTGKEVKVTDVRLLLFNPIDLRGIPTANSDKTLAIWLKPQIFQMDDSDEIINILFLDEISAAPQSVQAAAYQITLDRVVGEHRLPDNCIVIAAGNRVTDKSVSFKMPKALANRLLHLEVEGSFSSWCNWAISSGINDKVLGYLSFRNDRLFGFNAENDDLAFATPRSWEMVSSILNNVNDDIDKVYPMIAGLVGTNVASEFKAWSKIYKEIPSMKDIFEGRTRKVPKGTDGMYALVSAMTAYARENKHDLIQIGNSIRYAKNLPADFGTLLMENYEGLEKDFKQVLLGIPEYYEWMAQRGVIRNGTV